MLKYNAYMMPDLSYLLQRSMIQQYSKPTMAQSHTCHILFLLELHIYIPKKFNRFLILSHEEAYIEHVTCSWEVKSFLKNYLVFFLLLLYITSICGMECWWNIGGIELKRYNYRWLFSLINCHLLPVHE